MLGGIANKLHDRIRIPQDFNRLEKWDKDDKMKFSKDKFSFICFMHLVSRNQLLWMNVRGSMAKHKRRALDLD